MVSKQNIKTDLLPSDLYAAGLTFARSGRIKVRGKKVSFYFLLRLIKLNCIETTNITLPFFLDVQALRLQLADFLDCLRSSVEEENVV